MPFSDLTQLNSSDTFQTVFTRNNEMILKLNDLEVGSLRSDGSIILSEIGSTGGITLGVNFEKIIGVSGSFNLLISGPVPGGLTLNSAIGISGSGFGKINTTSAENSRKFLGFISGVSGSDSYTITTSGRIKNSSLQDNTLYYLDAVGGITSNRPTSNNSVIKPILFNINSTIGGIVLQQNEIVVSEAATSYIKSSSRTLAEITTNGSISVGNVVYYDVSGSTWAKSQANEAKKSEVFGIVESIGGITATIVTHGSINIPANILNSVGDGGAGGNDIWFLSAITGGHLQNLAPSSIGTIVKPVYYNYPHQFAGNTFSGYLINYIGYAAGGSVGEEQYDTSGIKIGEFKQVSFHGNRLGMKDWLNFLQNLIDGCTNTFDPNPSLNSDKTIWKFTIPYDVGLLEGVTAYSSNYPGSNSVLENFIDKDYVELSGSLLLAEEPDIIINQINRKSPFTTTYGINSLLTTKNDFSSIFGISYDSGRIPLEKFTELGVKSILKIKTNSKWNAPDPFNDRKDRWSQLKRLWFSQTDNNGKKVKLINWANASLLRTNNYYFTGISTLLDNAQSPLFSEFGDFLPQEGSNTEIGKGLDFNRIGELLGNNSRAHLEFKKQILTSFYLPGFVLDLDVGNPTTDSLYPIQSGCRTGYCSAGFSKKLKNLQLPDEDNPIGGKQLLYINKGYIPIYSNWMTPYNGLTADEGGELEYSDGEQFDSSARLQDWQEIGFCLPGWTNLTNDDPSFYPAGGIRFLFIYSPTYAIQNNIWDLNHIDLDKFFTNVSRIPGRFVVANTNFLHNIHWNWFVKTWNNSTSQWEIPTTYNKKYMSMPTTGQNQLNSGAIALGENEFLRSVVGIHLPDYSSSYDYGQNDNGYSTAISIPKTLMRVI